MTVTSHAPEPAPRWLRYWAVATVAVTAVPVALGGWVTTIKAGMADPVWPTTPWYLFFIDWTEPRPGFLIEHAHRLAGYLIGCMIIVLAAGLWFRARARLLRWLGVAALAAVILQGMLGGFRVVLNELFGTNLAIIHGSFAQIVLSVLVAIAVLTFPARPVPLGAAEARRLGRLSLFLAGLVFLQIIWGAILRHNPGPAVQRLHLMTAFLVVGFAVGFARLARGSAEGRKRFPWATSALIALLALQVMLGVEAWMGKFGGGVIPDLQQVTAAQVKVRIAHVLIGAGVFSSSVALAVRIHCPAGLPIGPLPQSGEAADRTPAPALAARGTHHTGGTA